MQARLHSNERIFSLAEWRFITNVYVKQHSPGVYCLPDYSWPDSWRWELFHLKDYVVSSVSAGTIWLVEREIMPPC